MSAPTADPRIDELVSAFHNLHARMRLVAPDRIGELATPMGDTGTDGGLVTNWNVTTINGKQFLVVDVASFRIPLDWDPDSNMFIAVAAPSGGIGNLPALLKGDQGDMPNLDLAIDFTALEPDDTTPDSAEWVQLNPTTYKLSLALHKGLKGDDGEMFVLNAGDVDSDLQGAGKILVVNPANNGFIYQTQKVGDIYLPGSIRSAPAGSTAYTLAPLSIPAQPWDCRLEPIGYTVITPNGGTDLVADLIARLGNTNPDAGETSGNDIGIGPGLTALTGPALQSFVAPIPPTASNDAWSRVPANTIKSVFIRVERRAGNATFTTSDATTRVGVRVHPLP